MTGTTSSPLGTASAPPGMKSFWTSTTMRQASAAAACGIPVSFQVGDQRGAEMAGGLLSGVHRHVAAKEIERLLADAEGAPVAGGAHHAGAGQLFNRALERRLHLRRRHDLVADQARFRARAVDAALGHHRLREPGSAAST